MKKKFLTTVLWLLLIALGCLTWLYADIMTYAEHAVEGDGTTKTVLIQPGETFGEITRHLSQSGIVGHPLKFRLYARMKGYDHRLKAGEYRISTNISPDRVLATLVSGKVRLHRLTVPEGLTLRQIGDLVAETRLCSAGDFIKMAFNADLAQELDIPSTSLEGYLFPDTYFFPKNVTAKKIITTMFARFQTVFTPQWRKRATEKGLTVHQVVTLASIIEKETGVAFERPVIASVFHNRLKKKMRLESDPTVIYGIKDFDGNLTRKHLSEKTPYNTYQIKGLPPGPIANPGAEALKAVLFPADTKFLFFVAKKNRTHQFSTNLKDHWRAVRKYQLKK